MGYATVIDVLAQDTGRGTYTGSSKPTADQVVLYIQHTAAELDALLRGQGYSLPIATTATQALELLEGYNALGGAAMVEQAAPTPAGKRGDAFHLWEQAKAMLAAGSIELDAAKDTQTSSPRSSAGSSPSAWFFRDQEF